MRQFVFLRKRFSMVGVAVMVVLTAASCGLLDGEGEATQGSTQGAALEKPNLKISIMPPTDLAPFHLAVKNGYFREAGFTFDPKKDVVTAKSSEASNDKLLAGEVDVAYASYPPFFLSQSKGIAERLGGLKLIADASSAGPRSCMVVAMPNSSVKSVRDMAGKRIAVTSEASISALLIKSTLKTHDVDYKGIQWIPTTFPDTAAALEQGHVHAAFLTEPFLSAAHKSVGAEPVFDTATGRTLDMATAGWAATGNFVTKYPKTIAAFQKIMARATEEAKADRSKVEALLQEFAKIDPDTAKLTTLLTFQSTLNATRIQRVPDLMLEFDLIKEKIDVSTMIVDLPGNG